MEEKLALGEAPLVAFAPVSVFIVAGGGDALAIARKARLDRAGSLGVVAVDLDDMVLDEGERDLWLAEIELSSEDERFESPPWLGEEVTANPKYTNSQLASPRTPG